MYIAHKRLFICERHEINDMFYNKNPKSDKRFTQFKLYICSINFYRGGGSILQLKWTNNVIFVLYLHVPYVFIWSAIRCKLVVCSFVRVYV